MWQSRISESLAAPVVGGREDGARPIRILVADDNARLRKALSQLMGAVEDLEVIGTAADGREAVALALALGPDVVLMDVSMPVLDGIEATRRICAVDPGVRVVIITAFHDRQDEALGAGAVDHLLKDTAPEELVRRVRRAAAL
jgi:DNA-binding NarL/FixJ family response regulator